MPYYARTSSGSGLWSVRKPLKATEVLSSASVLAHYDPQMPLRLAADASAYEVHGSSYF